MNDESGEMFNELTKWIQFLKRLRELSTEMESQEQDKEWLNDKIAKLIDSESDSYGLTFHDFRSPKQIKLSIEWGLVQDKPE